MKAKLRIAAILRSAADVMLIGGYVKGTRHNMKGAHCALGAIDAVTGVYSHMHGNKDIVQALSDMLPKKVGPDPYNYRTTEPAPDNHIARIATWSNNLCNSAQDVACVMRATAEYLELLENGEENAS